MIAPDRISYAPITKAITSVDDALVVSPPSVGNQVVVSPVRFRPTFRRGSTWVALLLGLFQYLPDIIKTAETGVTPDSIAAPWASAVVIAAIAMRDAFAAHGAAKVAAAAVNPTGPVGLDALLQELRATLRLPG